MTNGMWGLLAAALTVMGGIVGAAISRSVELGTYFQNNAQAHSDVKALQRDMEDAKLREAELKHQIEVVWQKLEEMEAKLDKALDENTSLVQQNEQLIGQHQQLIDQNAKLIAQNGKLVEQHDALLAYLQGNDPEEAT